MNRVFILGQVSGGAYAIESFNQTSFANVGYLALPELVGTPTAFARWGDRGLAILTYNPSNIADATAGTVPPTGMLYIISDSNFVSANAVASPRVKEMPPVHSFRRPSLIRRSPEPEITNP
jgi:hypothetical protein